MNIYILIYLTLISLYSVSVTCLDKSRAKNGGRRVPEKRLFIAAALGGSAAMYITMNIIRHKTKHKRFMIGLPLIMLIQAAIIILAARALGAW